MATQDRCVPNRACARDVALHGCNVHSKVCLRGKVVVYKEINAWNKRKGHQRLRHLGKEVAHILLTFAIGVLIATLYHELVTSKSIRSGAEKICTLYGKDENECKNNIDSVLNMSDDILDNNVNVKGE